MEDFNQHQNNVINDEPIQIIDLPPQKTSSKRFMVKVASSLYQHARNRRRRSTFIGFMFLILLCIVSLQIFNPFPTAIQKNVSSQKTSSTIISTPVPPDLLLLQHRPLHLPSLKAGMRCPTTQEQKVIPNAGIVQGKEPVYATIGAEAIVSPAVFYYADAQHFENGTNTQGWGGQKVRWFIHPHYQGLILIRGHQLDGSHPILFNTLLGQPPVQQLVIDQIVFTDTTNWPSFGSYTRLQAPGCYAYQVDGTNFSNTIIFQAAVQN